MTDQYQAGYVAGLRAAADAAVLAFGYEPSDGDMHAAVACRDAILDLIDQAPEPVPQGVKLLEWGGEFWNTADTPFCTYCVTEVGDERWRWSRSEYPYPDESEPEFTTEDDAKAAAQADYESRILSALTTSPVTPAEAARVLLAEINRPATAKDKPDWRYLSRLDMPSLRAIASDKREA